MFLLLIIGVLGFASCEKQEPTTSTEPRGVIIKKITLHKFPRTNPVGNYWDNTNNGAGPDIFLTIDEGETSNASSDVTIVFNDAYTLPDFLYTLNDPVVINDLDKKYTVGAYDSDGSTSEYIGSIVFRPMVYAEDEPDTFTLNTGDFSVTLEVEWTF